MADKQIGQEKKVNYIGVGLALGMAIGVGWGLALSAAADSPAFISIGIGSGMCMGLAIGSSLQRRHEQQGGVEPAGEDDEGAEQE